MSYLDAGSALKTLLQIALAFSALFGIAALFLGAMGRVRLRFLWLGLASFLLPFSALLLLHTDVSEGEGLLSFAAQSLYGLPYGLLLAFAFLLLLLALSGIFFCVGYIHSHLSPMSVKESFDDLPSGVCFASEDGVPLLTNSKMNEISLEIMGATLRDASCFWDELSKGEGDGVAFLRSGDSPLVGLKDGKVYSFSRHEHRLRGETVYEIVASDVSEPYLLSLDLEKKNADLKEFAKRLREHGEKIDEYTAEKETLEAKLYIHDELGKLLLLTSKRLSEDSDEEGKEELLRIWEHDLKAFGSTAEGPSSRGFEELEKAAFSIGVSLIYEGDVPKSGRIGEILSRAALECLTNLVSHAKGDELSVKAEAEKGRIRVFFTNNGLPPSGEIKEGGGLSSLRLLVERGGGVMEIKSAPRFCLILTLPNGGKA